MLSTMTMCKLLVAVRVFIFLSVCGFGVDSVKPTVCESLKDNSFDEVCKDLEILLGSCTLSEWLIFFETVVLDKVRLVDLYTVYTYLKTYFNCVLLNIIYSKPFSLKINQILIFEKIRKPCLNKAVYWCCFVLVFIKRTCNGGQGKHATFNR